MNELACKYCSKTCKNANSHRNHERLCKCNPEKQQSSFSRPDVRAKIDTMKREGSFMNGATKAKMLGVPFIVSEETRRKISDHVKNRTPEFNKANGEKISKTIRKKVQEGTWHYSFSKVRTHEYISSSAGKVRLHGSWEIAYAKYLDENNIRWRRPSQKTDKFYYEYEKLKNGSGYYIPDFYLIDTNEWIEVKGYETDKDRAKWKWFPHTLKVIKGDGLQALNLI